MKNSHNQERPIANNSFSANTACVANLLEVEFHDENTAVDLMGKIPDKINFIISLGSLNTVNIKNP